MMDLAPKAAQNNQSKGGNCNKIYVPELKAIAFCFFCRYFTGINSTIMKKNCLVEDNPEALEATKKDALDLHIRDKNIEVKMVVATGVGGNYENDTEAGKEELC